MAIEQLNQENNLEDIVNKELLEIDPNAVNFSLESKWNFIQIDPNEVDISKSVETFNESKGQIIFKKNLDFKEKANIIMIIIAQQKEKIPSDWTLVKDWSSWLYYINTDDGLIWVDPQRLIWLESISSFNFFVQSSLILGVRGKKGRNKRYLIYSTNSINLTS